MTKPLYISFHSKFPNPDLAGSTTELDPAEKKVWTFGRGGFCDFQFKRNGVSLFWSRLQATLVYVDELSEWVLFRGGTIPAKYTGDKSADAPSLPTGEVYFNADQLAHNERVILKPQDCISFTPGDGVTADFYEGRIMVAESLYGTVLPEVWEGDRWPGGKAKPKAAKTLPREVEQVVNEHLKEQSSNEIDTPVEAGVMVWRDLRSTPKNKSEFAWKLTLLLFLFLFGLLGVAMFAWVVAR